MDNNTILSIVLFVISGIIILMSFILTIPSTKPQPSVNLPKCEGSEGIPQSILGIKAGSLKGRFNKCSDYQPLIQKKGAEFGCFPFENVKDENLKKFENCVAKCDRYAQKIDGVTQSCKAVQGSRGPGSLTCAAGNECDPVADSS
jgi:hypothetical protein